MAETSGISELNITEGEGFITIEGTAPNEEVKFLLWEEYARINPEYLSGDLILIIATPDEKVQTYAVSAAEPVEGEMEKTGDWYEVIETERGGIHGAYEDYSGVVGQGDTDIRQGGITGTAPYRHDDSTAAEWRGAGGTGTEPFLESESED